MAPDDPPSVVVLAGPNGAGKSTAAPQLLMGKLRVSEFVNADDIARGLSGFTPDVAAVAAGRIMLRRIRDAGKPGLTTTVYEPPTGGAQMCGLGVQRQPMHLAAGAAAIGFWAVAAAPAAASVIGTFSSARPGIDYRGDLFGGISVPQARAATLGDGHTLVMDVSITQELSHE